MGYECGFSSVVKKSGINLIPEMLYGVKEYLSYEKNDWAKEHYPSAEEYVKAQGIDVYDKIVYDAYRDNYDNIDKDIISWCSQGRVLAQVFGFEDIFIESQDELARYIVKLGKYLQSFNLVSGYPEEYYIRNEEPGIISLGQCDGICVHFEADGKYAASYQVPCDTKICFTNDDSLDTDDLLFLIDVLGQLSELYYGFDFTNNYLLYWVSY